MEARDLRIFLSVVKMGSMSKAAMDLNYVQSNVTARIKHLEAYLGVRLLHRHRSGIVLTPAGRELKKYAERIVRLISEAEAAVSNHTKPQGTLVVGSMETTAAARLPNILAAYHRLYPEVDLRLLTGPSEQSLQRLQDGDVDAALVAGDFQQDSFTAIPVFEEELMLVAPPAVLNLSIADVVSSRDLRILVFRSGCSYRKQQELWLQSLGQTQFQTMEFGSIEGIMGCVAAGMGIAFLPRSVVDHPRYRETCSLMTIPAHIAKMKTWFVRRKDEVSSQAMKAFENQLLSAS